MPGIGDASVEALQSASDVRAAEDAIVQSSTSSLTEPFDKLLATAENPASPRLAVASLYALRRALLSSLHKQEWTALLPSPPPAHPLSRAQHAFLTSLTSLAASPHPSIAQASMLTALLGCAAGEPPGGSGKWREAFVSVLQGAVLDAARGQDGVCQALGNKFVARFADVRVWVCDGLAQWLRDEWKDEDVQVGFCQQVRWLLGCAAVDPEGEVELLAEQRASKAGPTTKKRKKEERPASEVPCTSKVVRKAERRAFSDAWMAFVSMELPDGMLDDLLQFIPSVVFPRVPQPIRFADFFTRAYNRGDVTALLALEGLFTLIAEHNLDYPLFYSKLYNVLDVQIFLHPHRAKFLTLIPKFLASKYLPSHTVAAFVKRLVRRAVHAPPFGALWCMRLALDLLRRHPATHVLVHRVPGSAGSGKLNFFDKTKCQSPPDKPEVNLEATSDGSDPYNDDEVDPAKSRAAESSLWELEGLRRHYCPAVARLVEAFGEDVRKGLSGVAPLPGDVSDYVDTSYGDLFAAEVTRRFKEVPLAYAPPTDTVNEEDAMVVWR